MFSIWINERRMLINFVCYFQTATKTQDKKKTYFSLVVKNIKSSFRRMKKYDLNSLVFNAPVVIYCNIEKKCVCVADCISLFFLRFYNRFLEKVNLRPNVSQSFIHLPYYYEFFFSFFFYYMYVYAIKWC